MTRSILSLVLVGAIGAVSGCGSHGTAGRSPVASSAATATSAAPCTSSAPPAASSPASSTSPAANTEPHTDATFDSNGVPIHYIDVGSGPPVLFIHGWADKLQRWDRACLGPPHLGMMTRVRQAGFRTIAYDLRGHGLSGKPEDPKFYGEEDLNDVTRLLDHLHVPKAYVVGYSRGGQITSRVAAFHGDRVLAAVAIGWGAGNLIDANPREQCHARAAEYKRNPKTPVVMAFLSKALDPFDSPFDPKIDGLPDDPATDGEYNEKALIALYRAVCDDKVATNADLAAAHVPFLAIVGRRDGMYPYAKKMDFPTLQLDLVPGASHPNIDLKPQTADLVIAFLRAQEGLRAEK